MTPPTAPPTAPPIAQPIAQPMAHPQLPRLREISIVCAGGVLGDEMLLPQQASASAPESPGVQLPPMDTNRRRGGSMRPSPLSARAAFEAVAREDCRLLLIDRQEINRLPPQALQGFVEVARRRHEHHMTQASNASSKAGRGPTPVPKQQQQQQRQQQQQWQPPPPPPPPKSSPPPKPPLQQQQHSQRDNAASDSASKQSSTLSSSHGSFASLTSDGRLWTSASSGGRGGPAGVTYVADDEAGARGKHTMRAAANSVDDEPDSSYHTAPSQPVIQARPQEPRAGPSSTASLAPPPIDSLLLPAKLLTMGREAATDPVLSQRLARQYRLDRWSMEDILAKRQPKPDEALGARASLLAPVERVHRIPEHRHLSIAPLRDVVSDIRPPAPSELLKNLKRDTQHAVLDAAKAVNIPAGVRESESITRF